MGVFKFLFKTTVYGAAGSAGAFALWTRNSKFVAVSSSDPLLSSPSYLKFNPNRNPAVHDVCVKRVPLDKIKPHLLEKEGKLTEAFCAGVWSGLVSKTPESIVVRCGDSPLKKDVRPSDGLFEMAAVVKRDEGVAEFRLTSVFYRGLGTATEKPMPPHIEFLHRLYTKLWMETAVLNVER
ncbi:hypothetical protein B7463_g2898, partial [Scytalidium lignicola]